MKTGWVALIAIGCLIVGGFLGMVIGGVSAAAGGTLVGVCYTSDVAVKEGLLSGEQSAALLKAVAARSATSGTHLNAAGDLQQACHRLPLK